MRPVLLALLLQLIWLSLPAQYYLTGEVLDVHGDKLQNVSIGSHSTGFVYQTGLAGEFRILSRTMDDTLTFAVDGYQSYTTAVHTTGYMMVTLKMNSFAAEEGGGRLVSLFHGGVRRDSGAVGAYSGRVENVFVPQAATAVLSGGVGRESYSTIRRFLNMGSVVPPDAVKIEELLNYFNFSYEEPEGKDNFHITAQVLSCPWSETHRLVGVRVCARKVDIHARPHGNLVLLVDASGSMDMPNKLPLIKSGIRLLVDNLRDCDTVSLVEFGRQVRVVFAGMPGAEKMRILRAVEGLRADGPSPGLQGLKLAYEVAKQQFIRGGENRVVLLTDGDVSMDPPAVERDLEELIGAQSEAGIRLSCGGLGMKSVKDSKLPSLAEIGRGDFAYLDDENTVEMLLGGELDQGLLTVANNISVSAVFSPALVREYRLIGFDNKRRVLMDTAAGLAGARMGSGSSLMALFEVVLKPDTTGADTLVNIKVSYCLPGQTAVQVENYDCADSGIPFERAGMDWKRAVCLAMFGMKLQRSTFCGPVGWMDLEKLARRVFTGSNYLDDEYMSLIDRAKRIYERGGN